jgi:ABC-type bacteriocin/lantibiotic exporter with double-glycine peptidase domain
MNNFENIFATEYGLVGITFISMYVFVLIFFKCLTSILKEQDDEDAKKRDKLLEDIQHLATIKTRGIILDRLVAEHPEFNSVYNRIIIQTKEAYGLANEFVENHE